MNFHRSPKIKVSPAKSLVGKHIATKVGKYSCRGPNSVAPAILKVMCACKSLFVGPYFLIKSIYLLPQGIKLVTP